MNVNFSTRNTVTLNCIRPQDSVLLTAADVSELLERVKSYSALMKIKASEYKPVHEAGNILVVSNEKTFFVCYLAEGKARYSKEYSLEACLDLASRYADKYINEFAYFVVDTLAYPRPERWSILEKAGFDKGEYSYPSMDEFNSAVANIQALGLDLDTTIGQE